MKKVSRIDAVFVPVTNLKKSEEWYLNVFPFKVIYRSSDGKYVGFRFQEKGDEKTALTLYQVDKVPKQEHIAFNFYTEDVDGMHHFLKSNGYKVDDIHGGDGMRFFKVFDPDGNVFELVTF